MKYMRNKSLSKDESGQAGIGTLIIFIAMVLVAAVAAAVLIQTSGVLQQKSQETGQQTIQEVSSNLEVVGIVGHRTGGSSNDFRYINVTLKPMAGAGSIDLSQMVVSMQNETKRVDSIRYNKSSDGMGSSHFIVTELRDDDDSLNVATTTTTVINSGDLVILCFDTTALGFTCPTREPIRLEIKPEHGASVIKDMITPPSYSVELYITLFP